MQFYQLIAYTYVRCKDYLVIPYSQTYPVIYILNSKRATWSFQSLEKIPRIKIWIKQKRKLKTFWTVFCTFSSSKQWTVSFYSTLLEFWSIHILQAILKFLFLFSIILVCSSVRKTQSRSANLRIWQNQRRIVTPQSSRWPKLLLNQVILKSRNLRELLPLKVKRGR